MTPGKTRAAARCRRGLRAPGEVGRRSRGAAEGPCSSFLGASPCPGLLPCCGPPASSTERRPRGQRCPQTWRSKGTEAPAWACAAPRRPCAATARAGLQSAGRGEA